MNFQLDHLVIVVETQHDNIYDLEGKGTDSRFKAACSPLVFKEQKRQLLAITYGHQSSSQHSHQRPIDWLSALENANRGKVCLLIEDLMKVHNYAGL